MMPPRMPALLQRLSGGDRRSIGCSNEVVEEVLCDRRLLSDLFCGLLESDPLVRMRAADAIEKIGARRPELLQPFKATLLRLAAESEQAEVRWHIAQMLPRLELTPPEQAGAIRILIGDLTDRSSIVKTCAMQALAEFAERDESLRPQIGALLEELVQTGTSAMKSRGKRLLKELTQRARSSRS
jgi:hypothetical protein